jgi:ABC-type nitrate/sulfonate/bicarbonate transport system substrate-binding protein
MVDKRNRFYVVVAALLIALTMTQCAPATPASAPTPQVIEKVVTKEVPKEVVVTKEVSKEVIVTKEVKVPADPVTLRTNWLYSGIHAWLFYGREKGYFREQNIELDIREGNGSGNVVRTVINKGDDFALVSIGNPIISTAQGAPLKIFTRSAFNWDTCADPNPHQGPYDLGGQISSAAQRGLELPSLASKWPLTPPRCSR